MGNCYSDIAVSNNGGIARPLFVKIKKKHPTFHVQKQILYSLLGDMHQSDTTNSTCRFSHLQHEGKACLCKNQIWTTGAGTLKVES